MKQRLIVYEAFNINASRVMEGYGRFNVGVSASFADPILVMFFLAKGLTYTQLMFLTTIAYVVMLLTEIPSGYIADRFGDKKIIIAGLFINIISSITFLLSNAFWMMVIASIFSALSSACISGADEAFSYRMLTNMNVSFDTYISKIKSYSFYFMGVVSVIGGLVYRVNIILPLIFNAVLYGVLMINVYLIHVNKKEDSSVFKGDSLASMDMFVKILKNKVYLYIVFVSVITALYTLIGKSAMQPLMDINKIDVALFGIVYFAINIIAGYGSSCYMWIKKQVSVPFEFIIFILLIAAFVGMYLLRHFWILVPIALLNYVRGLAGPFMSSKLNESVTEEFRATYLSVNSFLVSLVIALTASGYGLLVDFIGVKSSMLIIGASIILSILILKMLVRRVSP